MSNNEDNSELELPFSETLGRFIQTKPDEMLAIQNETMPDGAMDDLIDAFEASAQSTDKGVEFWYARDLLKLLDYAKWETFEQVITKAITACDESNQSSGHHFIEVFPEAGKNSKSGRPSKDFMLSRYACYLTAQNGASRKKPVAFAQAYFAIQTRKQEIAERRAAIALPDSEDAKRVLIREQMAEHNKKLSSAAKDAGVVSTDQFARFHSMGYKGLYGGMTKAEILNYKGLPKSAKILDRMGSTELAANLFRATQTEEKLRNEQTSGAQNANQVHYEVGREVREAMIRISGTHPENLPAADTITQAKKRLSSISEIKTIAKLEPSRLNYIEDAVIEPDAVELVEIDLKVDLWKYALLIMVQKPNMEISTSDLIAELPNYIRIPDGAETNNSSRGDSKFSQIVRNLKSHKDSATNFIHLGYAEGIPRGFRATEKGHAFVLDFFKDRLKDTTVQKVDTS